jgi:hypothetical protein
MPVTSDKAAPYAPAKTILDIILRFRDRGIPLPIDTGTLARASVPETLIPRVLQALRALDLITEDGQPTATFEGIRLAGEAEYKKRLEDWLRGTYADIFSFIDPAKDGETRIRDAFRNYQPVGQQGRMVTLFVGLCTAAGLIPESQASERPARPPRPAPTVTAQVRANARRIVNERPKDAPRQHTMAGLPAPLAGLLESLPAEGESWPAAKRDRFLATFTAVLDFCFPIEDEPDDTDDAEAA